MQTLKTLRPAPSGYPIKLVRDLTPEILNGTGEPGDLWYESAPAEALPRLLLLKLTEEIGEYLVDGGVEELADVLAVIEALAVHAHGVTFDALLVRARANHRGGFQRGVLMFGRHPEFDSIPDRESTDPKGGAEHGE